MNEITKIHLGRQAFTIAVDAHKALQAYLREIKQQVGDKANDVVDEVELRMAELLTERGVKGDKVVLLEDVNYLKEQLGSPRDFKDEDDAAGSKEQAEAEAPTQKRLFRDTHNAWLAGVCAGLGKYFGIDPTIIRLIFIALLFFGGGGVLLYIVLWLIVPEARTTSEQLQMQGKPVTVGSLKQIVDRADIEGAAKRASNVVGPVAQGIAKVILGIFGLVSIVIAASLLMGVTAFGMYAWVRHGVTIAGEHFFPTGLKETLLLLTGLASTAIVALFFLFSGMTMLKPKWKAPVWLSAALGCLLVLTMAGGTALFMDTAPGIRDRFNAMHHTATIPVSPFQKLVLNGEDARYVFKTDTAYKIEYRYLGKQPVAVFNKGVKDGTLTLDTSELRNDSCDVFCGYNDRDLTITIYAPSIDSVELSGADASFKTDGHLRQQDLQIMVNRDATLELPYMFAKQVTVTDRRGESFRQLDIKGIDSGSFLGDTINASSDNIVVDRTAQLVLNTNQECDEGDELVTMLSSDKVIINGTDATTKTGGLRALQSSDAQNVYNCVAVGPAYINTKPPTPPKP
jgi:phage shock protein PspC (stress-responsive transcriptional regulator)